MIMNPEIFVEDHIESAKTNHLRITTKLNQENCILYWNLEIEFD